MRPNSHVMINHKLDALGNVVVFLTQRFILEFQCQQFKLPYFLPCSNSIRTGDKVSLETYKFWNMYKCKQREHDYMYTYGIVSVHWPIVVSVPQYNVKC